MDELGLGLLAAYLLPPLVLGGLLVGYWKVSPVGDLRGLRRFGRLSGLLLLATGIAWVFHGWLAFLYQPFSIRRALEPEDLMRAHERAVTDVLWAGAALALFLLCWPGRRGAALCFGVGTLLVVGGGNRRWDLDHHPQEELQAARVASEQYEQRGWQRPVVEEYTRQVDRRADLYGPALTEQPPVFPQLEAALATRLAALPAASWQRLSRPAPVHVAFIVEADGRIHLPHVIQGLGPGYDEAAVRIVQSLPRCRPAVSVYGEPVAVVWQIAVYFPR